MRGTRAAMPVTTAAAVVVAALLRLALAVPLIDLPVDDLLDDRFNANYSLVNMPVMCTEEERACLSLGLLYHPPTRQCLPLGYSRKTHNTDCVYAARPCPFDGGAGHLQAECLTRTECAAAGSAVGRPLAFTGRCAARRALCACNRQPPTGLHLFGGAQCDCPGDDRRRPKHLLQPQEHGRCNVPDFSRDLHGREAATGGAPVRVRCPPRQVQCAGKGEVWYKGACWPLLEQGPCDNNYILRFTWHDPNHFAGCFRNETCQNGRLKFAADPHSCHSASLFGDGDDGGRLRRDAHGLWRVSFRGQHPRDPAAVFVCADAGEKLERRSGRERSQEQRDRLQQRPVRKRRGKNVQNGCGVGKGKGKGKGKAKKQRKATTISRPE